MKTNQSLAKHSRRISTNPNYSQLNLNFKRMQDLQVPIPKTEGLNYQRKNSLTHKQKNLIFLNFE